MSALEEAMIGEGVSCGVARNRIDEIIAGRFACRDFSDDLVPRRTVEQILHVARFAPSGANIQPWHVYVLAGPAKDRVSAALLEAHETCRSQHESEYKYYAIDLPEPYLNRRQEFGRRFYGSLGIAQTDVEDRSRQTAKNYAFFGAPVGLIVTIDRRLEVSWLPSCDIHAPNSREVAGHTVPQQLQRRHDQQSVAGPIDLTLVQRAVKPPAQPHAAGNGE
jgi:hypothetical protein